VFAVIRPKKIEKGIIGNAKENKKIAVDKNGW